MPLRTLSQRGRAMLCSALLLALVLVQSLGFIHRIVHASPMLQAGAVPRTAPAMAAVAERAPQGWQALFAGHMGEHACDLYDLASQADLLGTAAPGTATIDSLPEAFAHRLSRGQSATPVAAFLARGPPVVTS